MFPILSYCFATFIMYTLCKTHKYKAYHTYTGWSRFQSLCCIPFLYSEKYKNVASTLIWLNSIGCYVAVHVFYIVTKYEVLHILAERSFCHYPKYTTLSRKQQYIVHFIGDTILHGTPVFISYCILPPVYKNEYIWILPASIHVSYSYLLLGIWNPNILYQIYKPYPHWKLAWAGTIMGYYIINKTLINKFT